MKNILLISGLSLFGLCQPPSFATEVYITIDEDGNRIFSDTPSKQSHKHHLKEISIIPAIKLPKTTATAIDESKESIKYELLSIISPKAETHLTRDKLGDFIVSAQLSPGLQEMDEAVLLYDDKEINSGMQLSWQINNAERGAHTLQVIIRQRDNKLRKISSQLLNIYVKR
ncbi:MAG: DUF4124 domain-containing protein [Oleispira sp.]|nr:DUF4124 domain-containing protein [Oleispira sp.]